MTARLTESDRKAEQAAPRGITRRVSYRTFYGVTADWLALADLLAEQGWSSLSEGIRQRLRSRARKNGPATPETLIRMQFQGEAGVRVERALVAEPLPPIRHGTPAPAPIRINDGMARTERMARDQGISVDHYLADELKKALAKLARWNDEQDAREEHST